MEIGRIGTPQELFILAIVRIDCSALILEQEAGASRSSVLSVRGEYR